MNLIWNARNTPSELHPVLRALGEEYPLLEGSQGVCLSFEKVPEAETLRVTRHGDAFLVTYGDASFAARGVAYALSGQECDEKICFRTHGILLDCSRTFVVRPDYFKRWLRRLALLGYNMAMLYTKDTYRVPGETYFGYMRGAYSMEEIREIDAYAQKLGIEMIASIQALGHLEPILRWGAYYEIRDTDNVILVDCEKSYLLLEKMIRFWSEALGTRRIHLGMDETHDLGRGRFMDMHGYERPFDIYNRHLKRLCGICEKYSLRPIIWNDMYFRYANKAQDYYDADSPIPQDVKDAIPKMVQLSYWDYYHRDEETYLKMLDRTRGLNGGEPFMASGIWTWSRLWYDAEQTLATVKPCIDACRRRKIRDMVYTMWGDDGGYCEFESAFAGMAWAADCAFNGEVSEERLSPLYRAVCGTSYELQTELGKMEIAYRGNAKGKWFNVNAPSVLWDDPLMGIVWHEMLARDPDVWRNALETYRVLRDRAEAHREDRAAGIVNHAWNILNVLAKKVELRLVLLNAYGRRDFSTLGVVAEKYVPEVIDALEGLNDSFRDQWFRGYKSYGLEIMQIRLAGLRERYTELARRIGELLDGRIDRIDELELRPETAGLGETRYRMIATGGWFV